MAGIEITFRALTPKRFRFAQAGPINDVSNYMHGFLQDIVDEVKQYPPIPVNSTYERTYLLFSSWSVGRPHWLGSGLYTTLNNWAPYAAFVQGDFQTHVHQRNGWMRVRDLVKSGRSTYRAGIQRIVQSHLGR